MAGSAILFRRLFLGASVLWAATIPFATRMASLDGSSTAGYLIAATVYATGSLVCHQLPQRSFHLWGHQLPVCARCTGLYFGAAAAALVALVSRPTGSRLAQAGVRARLTVLAVAAAPAALTLVYEWTTGTMPSNVIRAFTGVLLGAATMWIIVDAMEEPIHGLPAIERPRAME
jgi:uncharacterized membrane protein